MVTVSQESSYLKHKVEKSDESPNTKCSCEGKGHGKGSSKRSE